jgi:predicted DNA binding CopG/RHH family protein
MQVIEPLEVLESLDPPRVGALTGAPRVTSLGTGPKAFHSGEHLYLRCQYSLIAFISDGACLRTSGYDVVWHGVKAAENQRKHGISFEEAVTVFDDPSAPRPDCSQSYTSSSMANPFASSQRDALQRPRKLFMINERLKKHLKKDRPSTTITMRIPTDVVESLKTVAPIRGFTAYQTLLKSYINEGLRRDDPLTTVQTFGAPKVINLGTGSVLWHSTR